MKKKAALLLAAMLVAASALSACGSDDAGSSGSSQDTTSAAQSDGGEKDYSEPLTIQLNVRDTDKVIADKRTAALEEMFNVTFDFVACSLNDVTEKTRVWVAGGDMPEVMWMDHKISRTNEVLEWIEGGVFKAFPDLSEDYPNLSKINDSVESKNLLIVDGKQYIYAAPRASVDYDGTTSIFFYYRADWAEQLGMYQDEYTWDEMVELVKAFNEQDPGGNGEGKTIGMVGSTWAFPGFAGLDQWEPYWSSYKLVDGEYVWGAALDTTIEGIKEAKRLYDEGVIWKDQPLLASDSDAWGRYESGQSGIVYSNMNTIQIQTVMTNMLKNDPDLDVSKAFKLMKVRTPEGKVLVSKAEDYYGAWGFSSTISDEKQERFLDIMEYIASEDGENMCLYGLEGEDFVMNNGEVELLWEKDADGKYISPFENGSDRLFSFVTLLSEKVAHTLPTTMKEACDSRIEQIEYTTDNPDLVYAEINYELNAFSAPNKDKYTTLGSEVSDKIVELILSSTAENIEADYRAWLAETQPKADAVLEELNGQFLAGK